ncbi:SGT1 protein-domain-containing protein [Cristinia sonorae]|uniref:SGT1 protein-domain-containing protein n=1 Tax=Cristinia sonorae TaxID=1940300 RepID=A0A8K0UPG6_9AGAR|nr:SGT1 protein-domain-containing protein [Cristinia sonorae]
MDIFSRPPAISEDTLHYVLYPTEEMSDKVSAITLAAVIQSFVDSLLVDHLWHRDGFQLKVAKNEDGHGYVLEGRMRVGDCVDDEWCAVWLLREISSKWDAVISVNDTDGEFLLIEAADYLPSWVTPTNAENRVWIYRSHLHLIPISHVSAPSSEPPRRRQFKGDSDDEDGLDYSDNEDYLSVEDAIKLVRNPNVNTQASREVETAVEKKIYGYPAAISQHVHHTKVYVPVDIAMALSVKPSLVQKPVETFYTRDALQLRAAHRMARFPPEPSVLTTIKMTRTAYAQLLGQKFYPPKIFGRWQELEGTPERRWRDVGMKLACGFEMIYQESKGKSAAMNSSQDGMEAAAQARKDLLQQNPDYRGYLENLTASGYFKGEVEGSTLWKQLEDKAIDAFLAARRDDDATRPTFASEFNEAVSQATDVTHASLRDEDSDSWLNIDAEDFDAMLGDTLGPNQANPEDAMNVDGDEKLEEEERLAQRQTTKLQEMAKKVEEFVEGKGDLEGARFHDEDFSDEDFDDGEVDSDGTGSDSEDGDDASPEAKRTAREIAMARLVPPLDPSEYGKMPPSFHSNSQRVARENAGVEQAESVDPASDTTAQPSREEPRKMRPPIIPRDQYDGVDSDDETDEEGEQVEDEESEEEKPQVVGEIDIDMEEEQEEFLEFARQALGMSDEQWAKIVQERIGRGAFVPTTAVPADTAEKKKVLVEEPAAKVHPKPERTPNPNLDSFEAVMAAMDAELGRTKPGKAPPRTSTSDKGEARATEPEPEVDIEAAMDAEFRRLVNGDERNEDEDDIGPAENLDYNLIKNFLESFKGQNGLSGPVGNLIGRLQPGWTLPRDEGES